MSTTEVSEPRRIRALATAVLAAVLLLLAAAPSLAQPPPQAEHERTLSVLTRNLYLGASLTPLFPDPPFTDPMQLVAATTQMWQQVLATDYAVRAEALADEIAGTTPDLIGLQEVTLYRIGAPGDPAPAETVRLDFLEVLLDELAERGLDYTVASEQAAFDGELTGFDWSPAAGGTGTLVDIRLTDRDVILVRDSPETANLKVTGEQSGLYETALTLPVLGQPLRIERGWTAVDIKHRGREVRFINTHLEAFAQPIAQAQVAELLSGPAATAMPVILVGDFNSAPGQAAYELIVDAGFTDVAVGGGPTCCYDAALADPTSTLDTRIDLVFVRGPLSARDVTRVGVDRLDRTAPPLWASDHAGLYADIVLH